MIRVLLEDGFSLEKGTGIGNYTLSLMEGFSQMADSIEVQLLGKPYLLQRTKPKTVRRIFYILWINTITSTLRRGRFSLAHFTNFWVPVLKAKGVPYVVTIHDLAPLHFPQAFSRAYQLYFKQAVELSIKTSDLVLTVSETIRKEVLERFPIEETKIRTAYAGLSPTMLRSAKTPREVFNQIAGKRGIKTPYFLFIGTLEKRKNILTLVRSFRKIRKEMECHLVLAGRPGHGYEEIQKELGPEPHKDGIILAGYVSEEEKIALYDWATALVFPSLYEGFGIPLVEAMSRQVPIVASRIATSEEIAGEAALFVDDPLDEKSFSQAMAEILQNPSLRNALTTKGARKADAFSPVKVAKLHLEAYLSALAR